MKFLKGFFALGVCALFLAACGGQDNQATSTADTQADTNVVVEKWLEVRYDDLRLRESAGMQGKVLATLKTGDQVKDLGEVSKGLETVTLRGQRITAPWGKVETKAGQQGWIFLGALLTARDPAIDTFKSELMALKGEDCKVIQKGMDLFKARMKGKPDFVVDQAVPELDYFIDSVLSQMNTAMQSSKEYPELEKMGFDEEGSKDPATQKLVAGWNACGLHLEFPEGIVNIVPNPGLTIPALEPLVSPAMRAYLNQRKKELTEGWSEDAALLITPRQLADRAVFWDEFIVQHPTFYYAPWVRDLAHQYAVDLILGANNTPSLSYEAPGTLLPEFKSAYEWVMQEHPKTETAHWVQQWYDLLKANGWKKSRKSDAFATKLYQ